MNCHKIEVLSFLNHFFDHLKQNYVNKSPAGISKFCQIVFIAMESMVNLLNAQYYMYTANHTIGPEGENLC